MRRRLALWLCPGLRSELETQRDLYLGAVRAAERQRDLARMSPQERAEWRETWRDIQRGRVPR